jgi:phospholipid/cholesterol/gamma-HCH transport system substrate-binding protein
MYDYTKGTRWRDLKLGVLITAALALICAAVLFVHNIKDLFESHRVIYALFDDVTGLKQGAIVRFSGVEIGAVQSLAFRPDSRVKVAMSIQNHVLHYLKKDSRAVVLTFGLLGDKYIQLTSGSGEAERLKEGEVIPGETPVQLREIIRTSQESIGRVNDFMGRLNRILDEGLPARGSLGRLVKEPDLYESLKKLIDDASTVLASIRSKEGTVGKLIGEDHVYKELKATFQSLRVFSSELERSRGTLHALIEDPEVYDRFLKMLRRLDDFTKEVSSSTGTLDLLIHDPSLYDNVNSASEKMDSLLHEASYGQGVLGTLLRDEELSEELKGTLAELKRLLGEIRENPEKFFSFHMF